MRDFQGIGIIVAAFVGTIGIAAFIGAFFGVLTKVMLTIINL